MGLESVELVLAIEDEFNIEFGDDVAKIRTVGDVYDHIKARTRSRISERCVSQICFHRLRQAISGTYGIPRKMVKLNTKLTELMPSKEVREGWPYLELFAGMRVPKNVSTAIFSRQKLTDVTTVRDLVDSMVAMNDETIVLETGSDDELWAKLVKVFVRHLNISEGEIRKGARIVEDLGVD